MPGCPNLFRVENRGERAVVVCTADPRPARPWPDAPHVHDELVELAVGRAPLCWREGSRHGLTDEAF